MKQELHSELLYRYMEQLFLECFLSGTRGGAAQHLEPLRGEKSRVGRLFTFAIRSERGMRESHPHQVTALASRVTTATGSPSIATREAAGTSPPIASLLYPPLSPGQPQEHRAQHRLCFHAVEAFPTQPAFSLDTGCHSVLGCPSPEGLISWSP